MKKGILLAAVALLLIAGGGFFAYKKFGPGAHAGAAAGGHGQQAHGGPGMAMPVKVVVTEKKPLRIWTSYSGRLTAVEFVELRPQVDGRLEEIKFADGQIVNKGDVLFVIDPRPYEATLTQAEAAIKAAKSQHEFAVKELSRAQDLIKTDTISKKVLDERENAARVAKNTLDAAQAALDKAQINVDHAYLEAPISGRVSRPEITVGNLVQTGPNAPVLATIVSNEGIYADFEVDEQTYLNNIRGQAPDAEEESAVPVQLALSNGKTYQGHIKSFDNRINTSTGTIRARAYFANEGGELLPGMYATVRMGTPEESEAILVTEHAIGTDQDRRFVYVVRDGKATYREVQLGASIEGKRVITAGLEPGEQVIAEGIMKIQPEMPVTPQVVEESAPVQQQAVPAPQTQIEAGTEPEDLTETAPAAGDKPDAAPAHE